MPKKVLIVDDEVDAVEFVKEIAEDEGYTAIFAHDGPKGLEKMRQEKPDLVILDVQMPGMDGFEVFAEMKKDENLKNIPVIMLTGIKDKVGLRFSGEAMKDYLGHEPDDYIEKPIDPVRLKDSMKKILSAS